MAKEQLKRMLISPIITNGPINRKNGVIGIWVQVHRAQIHLEVICHRMRKISMIKSLDYEKNYFEHKIFNFPNWNIGTKFNSDFGSIRSMINFHIY